MITLTPPALFVTIGHGFAVGVITMVLISLWPDLSRGYRAFFTMGLLFNVAVLVTRFLP
jgi:hypothetical protein